MPESAQKTEQQTDAATPTQNQRTSPYAATDFSLILALFFTSRLMMLMAFPPENLIFYGDYLRYFNIADITRQGFYPYFHFWFEFPPVFTYLNIAIYMLAGQQLKNFIPLLAFVLLLVECGNLYLLYRLALTLHGPARGIKIAWIYTALFVPVFFWLGNFDALTTFFVLLGLYSLLKNKKILLALSLGVGAMVKFVPILLLATIWRVRDLKRTLVYAAATLVICLVILAPFALVNPRMTLASVQAQAGKSSYQTVWALIDGNYTTGNFGPLSEHFDAANASKPVNNPARIPTWLTLIPFGVLGFYILKRPQVLPDSNLDAVIFTALTFIIFFLWAQGWSPQWQTFLIPLLLLTFPEKRAVMFIIVLGFVNFLEWPVILSRGLNQLIPLTIIIRTLIFILIGFELYQMLTRAKKHV